MNLSIAPSALAGTICAIHCPLSNDSNFFVPYFSTLHTEERVCIGDFEFWDFLCVIPHPFAVFLGVF
jgi:hypothetical protein